MIGKTPSEHQLTIFEVALESFIDMNHELVLLSKQIDWDAVESEFAQYYCVDNGRPSVPIRKMVGMRLLKNGYKLSDEWVVARWMENPYMQDFTGERGEGRREKGRCSRSVRRWTQHDRHDEVPEADWGGRR